MLATVLLLEWGVALLFDVRTMPVHLNVCSLRDAYPWWRLSSCYFVTNWMVMGVLFLPACLGAIGLWYRARWARSLMTTCNVLGVVTLSIAALSYLALRFGADERPLSGRVRILAALWATTMMVQLLLAFFLKEMRSSKESNGPTTGLPSNARE